MHVTEGNSISLPELAKEKFLDTAQSASYFAVHREPPKKAEFVLCKKQRIIYWCNTCVLITNISTWNHVSCILEELLSSVQTRPFFNHTFHFKRKFSMQIAKGTHATVGKTKN